MTSKAKSARSQKHHNGAGEKNGKQKQKNARGKKPAENTKSTTAGKRGGKPSEGDKDGGNNNHGSEQKKRGREIIAENRLRALCAALAHCEDEQEFAAFLADLCTPQEIDALAERWLIARLLAQGDMSYRDISAATGASTTTVGRVARFLQQEPHHGYRLVLARMREGLENGDNKPANNRRTGE